MELPKLSEISSSDKVMGSLFAASMFAYWRKKKAMARKKKLLKLKEYLESLGEFEKRGDIPAKDINKIYVDLKTLRKRRYIVKHDRIQNKKANKSELIDFVGHLQHKKIVRSDILSHKNINTKEY